MTICRLTGSAFLISFLQLFCCTGSTGPDNGSSGGNIFQAVYTPDITGSWEMPEGWDEGEQWRATFYDDGGFRYVRLIEDTWDEPDSLATCDDSSFNWYKQYDNFLEINYGLPPDPDCVSGCYTVPATRRFWVHRSGSYMDLYPASLYEGTGDSLVGRWMKTDYWVSYSTAPPYIFIDTVYHYKEFRADNTLITERASSTPETTTYIVNENLLDISYGDGFYEYAFRVKDGRLFINDREYPLHFERIP